MSFDEGPLEAPTLLRRLRADEAPFAGDLRAGDPPAVWVRADDVPPETWRVRGGEHVLAPLDVARTPEGHDVLLPHCPARLDAVIARSGRSLPAGAVVTAAVSLIRGAAEARRCEFTTGRWWVDAAGQPLLAPGGDLWTAETAALLGELVEGTSGALRAAVLDAAALVTEADPPSRRHDRVEEALFDAAEPSPLRWTTEEAVGEEPAPRRVTSLRHAMAGLETEDGAEETGAVDRQAAWATRLVDRDVVVRAHGAVAGVGNALSGFVAGARAHRRARSRGSTARTDVDRPARSPRRGRGRRAPLIVAAAVGIAVTAGGLAWPDNHGSSEAVETVAEVESASETPTAEPTAAPPGGVASENDRIEGVLTALSSCAREDHAPCDAVREDPMATPPSGVVTDDSVARDVALLDEYGGVFVYRVAAQGHTPQVLVLVEVNGEWLVRDVYDVADQP